MGIWLGRKQIPPIPKETVLEDRSTGDLYAVTRSGNQPAVASISEPISRNRYWVYEAYREPTLETDGGDLMRIFVDGGSISTEEAPFHYRNAPIDVVDKRRPLTVYRILFERLAIITEDERDLLTQAGDNLVTEESSFVAGLLDI